MMTREDVWRELELLPVWTLRTPLVSLLPTQLAELPTAVELSVEAEQEQLAVQVAPEEVGEENSLPMADAPVVTQIPPQLLQYMLNEDGDCMFVFAAAELQIDEAILLRNMVMAMAMKTKSMATPADISEAVGALKPKLLIALGESTVQYLLQTKLPLADLRGRVHAYQGVALVTSYDLAHLLLTFPDKALAWDDFCLALNMLHSLKSAN